MSTEGSWRVTLTQEENYRFRVSFDNPDVPPLITDENAPLGGDAGPNPSRLLATAVANCLAASLIFALRKFRNEPAPVQAFVDVGMARNAANRLRVGHMAVDIQIGQRAAEVEMLERVLAQFEDFCVVTQSVRAGFPVSVAVRDADGVVVKAAETSRNSV